MRKERLIYSKSIERKYLGVGKEEGAIVVGDVERLWSISSVPVAPRSVPHNVQKRSKRLRTSSYTLLRNYVMNSSQNNKN